MISRKRQAAAPAGEKTRVPLGIAIAVLIDRSGVKSGSI